MAETTIYAVTQGSYSDYRVAGVFSTRERAERFIAAYGTALDDPGIEEYQLDPQEADLSAGRLLYWVFMRDNGDDAFADRAPNETAAAFKAVTVHDGSVRVRARVYATSQEHAIKIVNEQRLQWIAAGKPEASDAEPTNDA